MIPDTLPLVCECPMPDNAFMVAVEWVGMEVGYGALTDENDKLLYTIAYNAPHMWMSQDVRTNPSALIRLPKTLRVKSSAQAVIVVKAVTAPIPIHTGPGHTNSRGGFTNMHQLREAMDGIVQRYEFMLAGDPKLLTRQLKR